MPTAAVFFLNHRWGGYPIIRTITEGLAGNKFNGVYGSSMEPATIF